MLSSFQSVMKARLMAVLLIIHAGLGLGVYSVARASYPNGWDQTSCLVLATVVTLYGGFVLAVEHWTERLISDLPVLIEQLPKLIAVAQSAVAVWKEAKASPLAQKVPALS
jgi:hypothetical protein